MIDHPQAPPGTDVEPLLPPGLEERSGRSGEPAALVLGALGGFMVIAAVLLWIATSAVEDVERLDGDSPEADDAAFVRAVTVPTLLVISVPYLVAMAGLMQRASWGRKWGVFAAILALFMVPAGTVIGIVALSMLGRGAGRPA